MVSQTAAAVVWPSRYDLLDGLRGTAALVVVLNHLDVVSSNVGHFAVMVFFAISGYCITASAEACRRNGVGFIKFMVRRVRRIFPPYLLAIVFFAATRVIKAATGRGPAFHRPIIDWVQNLTLTQWVSNLSHPVASPVQNPKLFVVAFWSLNYEEQFYLVMGIALVFAIRQRLPLILPVLCFGIIGVIWNWLIPGSWICGLFIEYWVHFALGSCLYYVLTQPSYAQNRHAFILLAALLGAFTGVRITLLKIGDPYEVLRTMTELCFLSAVVIGLFLLRPYSTRICQSRLWRPLAALGTISYSLYLIHQFNLTLVAFVAQHIIPLRSPHFVMILTEIFLFIALATMFWWLCERPFLREKTDGGHISRPVTAEPRPA
jgi:peptidoglycan/LPS O-acetylase OafA/YrhL